ncbi:MAG TPA: NAD(P)/FAD-dependent oxidoreductase [Acidimicrobiales bacterium]|nr:NAD(P)/FAD-dependent oxidoreductase [Acidimicrobiales bacterium]
MTDTTPEVIVVGARPAGAATAMLLARQGHDVLVVDRASLPSDTISTHAIARGGVVQLARWGLLDAVVASGAPRIRTVSFTGADGTVLRRPVKARAGVDFLLAPRRPILDTIVLSAALDAGARFASGLTVTGLLGHRRVAGVEVRDRIGRTRRIPARLVVGADGVRSRVAREAGAVVVDDRGPGGAAHYAYVAGLDGEGIEFHLGPGAFAGVFPTHGGEANVWVCTPAGAAVPVGADRTGAFLALVERASPALAARVRAARITSPVRGAAGLPNHVRQAGGPGWALVGDAGYHRDPITGHGITDAFRDADLAATHLGPALRGEVPEGAALAAYAAERDRALGPVLDLTCRLAGFPPPAEFADLQRALSAALDAEAVALAARPPLAAAARRVA